MIRHVASATVPCQGCGANGKVTYVASVPADRLRCSESFHCAGCGCTTEADGDQLSDHARAAFLATEGRWRATIEDLGLHALEAIRVLRVLLPEATLGEAMRIARDCVPIVEGVLVEARHVEAALTAAGARITVARVAEPPA